MADEPTKSDKTRPQSIRPQTGGSSSSKGSSTSNPPGLTTGEPARRDISAKSDSAIKGMDPSRTPDKSGKLNRTSSSGQCVEDAGTPRKGMRADDTTMSSGSCSPGEHLEPAGQQEQKSRPKQQIKNAPQATASDKKLETKPTRTPEKR